MPRVDSGSAARRRISAWRVLRKHGATRAALWQSLIVARIKHGSWRIKQRLENK